MTGEITRAWGVGEQLIPMTDDRVATVVELADGTSVSFQEYFVRLRHSVPVRAVRFAGADRAVVQPRAATAMRDADVVVIAPSNPSSRSARSRRSPAPTTCSRAGATRWWPCRRSSVARR
ncbi:MAG: 2-phospho-L-lactate transferase CofD family protein [Ilumatobacteraceae bacterium]